MKRLAVMSEKEIRAAEKTLSAGTWAITAGAVLFSVLTVTPLVHRVSPDGWNWTAPILPLVVDAAVVIVVRLDAVVSRLGGNSGRWPAVLRWMTGAMTLALNIGESALRGDLVGVAVHSVAPLLLIVTAEAGLAYRRAITAALDRIAREQAEAAARERADRAERERLAREERERERAARERSEREAREHVERLERERAEREARERREEREHAAALAREQAEREEAQLRAEREERARVRHEERERADRERRAREEQEAQQRAEREQQARQARERREQAARERQQQQRQAAREHPQPQPVNTFKAAPMNANKLPEQEARAAVRAGLERGRSVRETAEETGWSVGWVSARYQEIRNAETADPDPQYAA